MPLIFVVGVNHCLKSYEWFEVLLENAGTHQAGYISKSIEQKLAIG